MFSRARTRSRAASIGRGGWNPLADSALVLSADADLGITLNGSDVAAWADQSGNGNHLVMATALYQPEYQATGLNGRPAILWSGAQVLHTVGNLALGAFTVLMSCKFSGAVGILYEHSALYTVAGGSAVYGTNSVFNVQRGATTSLKNYSPNWAVDNVARVVGHRYNGTAATHEGWIDGAELSLTDAAAGDPGVAVVNLPLYLGARGATAAAGSTGHVRRVLVYNRYLTDSQMVAASALLTEHMG
jgi:hypothetical protein